MELILIVQSTTGRFRTTFGAGIRPGSCKSQDYVIFTVSLLSTFLTDLSVCRRENSRFMQSPKAKDSTQVLS